MSIHQLLSTARKSFQVLDAAMNTTGQNIANAGTEGYARQRVTLQSDSTRNTGIYTRWVDGSFTGAGVSVADIERLRDTLLVSAGRDTRSLLGASDEEHRILSSAEALFPSTEGARLTDLLDGFWNSWADLSNHPTDDGIRQTVLARSVTLADAIRQVYSGINDLQDQTRALLSEGIDEINDITTEIVSLNEAIASARMAGSPDFASEDRRDTLVDELALLAPIRVNPDAQQGYTITINGATIVQGVTRTELNADLTSPTATRVTFGDTGIEFQAGAQGGGKLGTWLRTANTDLEDLKTDLNTFAETLADQVNTVHGTSVYDVDDLSLPAANYQPFFTYTVGSGATTLDVTATMKANPSQIAPANLFKDNQGQESVALAIASLRGEQMFGQETAEGQLINVQSGLGASVRAASTRTNGQRAILDHLTGMEKAVSGVNLDEEMTDMIKLQQAFAASARVLNTAQEMMDTLFSI